MPPRMSLSPADILQRLKQLKLWQESQEKLLSKTKIADSSATPSDYQTIEGLSAFDSTDSEKNWETPLTSPSKSFNELLEEKLAQDVVPVGATPKVKKPFLRKGTGLQRFRMKRPAKPARVTPLRVPDVAVQAKASWSKVEDLDDHVRKINAQLNLPKAPAISEQTLYEKELEKELLIFEALEQKADNSSFCSTNSSVMRILSNSPSKVQSTIPEEKRVHWESEDEDVIETNLGKEDIAEILLRLKSLAESSSQGQSTSEISETETSSDSTSIASTDLEETIKSEKRDICIGTDNSDEMCVVCGDKFQKSMEEYEKKMKEMTKEKGRIGGLKNQVEHKEKDFLKKKREFDDERQEFLFELETEKKKLLKEKAAFQAYVKESQNRPNKKERQEISSLKKEVADLRETSKLKESKNGMTQARLRNQIKQLEKENSKLKEEVEKLTKENAKLTAAQKLRRKSSDAKILQEINKNVTKLTLKSSKDETHEKVEAKRDRIILDDEDSLLEITRENTDRLNLEVQYENAFRNLALPEIPQNKTPDKVEQILEDNSKRIKYSNGNVKTISPDGNFITVQYFNGDRQQTNLLDGTVKYFFHKKSICQTTYADGLEVVEFPEGVTEKRFTDGRCEVTLSDGVIQTTFLDHTQETKYTDGSIVRINSSGEKILLLPNGQKEVETAEYKRREYPDGTIKILYPDGTQETKYSNGRVRIKDGNGALLLDTL